MRNLAILLLLATTATVGLAGDLKGKGEVAGFGGGVWISEDDIGTKKFVGGSVGGGVTSTTLVYGEFAFIPVINEGGFKARVYDFQGGIKQNLMTSDKVEPYVILGAGMGRLSVTGPGTSGESESAFAIHLGAGVRLYASPKWGIQPEFKYGRYFFNGDGVNVARFGAGVFFQW